MNLSAWMPFWNSLDAVRRIHSDLELGAIVFFLLLALFDAFAHWTTDKKKEHIFGAIGIVFFFIAVTFEFLGYAYGQRNDSLSEMVIVSLDAKSQQADIHASKALTDSGKAVIQADDALAKTGAAKASMDTAKDEAAKARAGSAEALTLATGARKEADTFEADITAARKDAADAESHLAEARERAAAAETKVLELNEKLADRTLTDAQLTTISNKLKKFGGQEYEVTTYWESPESLNIANRIHAALLLGAKWKFNPDGGKSQMMGGQVGVQVWNHPDADESTKRAAEALVEALNAEGISAVARQQNPKNPKTNIINMNVGSKR